MGEGSICPLLVVLMSKIPELKGADIAIVCMGRSHINYTIGQALGKKYYEVWAVNAMAIMLKHERVFMLDPPSRFLDTDDAGAMTTPMADYLKNPGMCEAPIYSCELDDRCPTVVEYPLGDVLEEIKFPYLNNTTAYAIAYGIYQEVGSITVYGADYTYSSVPHYAEAGRACVEYWLAFARSKGIGVGVAPESSLLDMSEHPSKRLYGYHRLDDPMAVITTDDGNIKVGRASDLKTDIQLWEAKRKAVAPPEPKNA